jgi:membrane protein implicated in regulation of membrane protease activity
MPGNKFIIEPETRPLTLFAIAVTGVLVSAFLGGSTNAVNGLVSPRYFVTILRWHDVTDVWRASIAQGVFEGFCFGVFFSLVFTTTTGIITGASCSYGFAVKHLFGVLLGAYLCWAIGGLAAMGLATLSPEFYSRTFIGVPQEFGERLAYAWVGGSIWGAELGGLLSVVLGLVVLQANWRRLRHATGQDRQKQEAQEGQQRQSTPTEERIQGQHPYATDHRIQGRNPEQPG